ncbi:LPD29 domain-containing protein [Streptomyces sp. NPDC051662]|uniref:LPD29 domain-containing protein n=1 Tax=Streptomyces sp. NPDC051662 TaxID=3154750 RepID=UPI00341F38D2
MYTTATGPMDASAAYLALRLPAGTKVTYQGTLEEGHGQWLVSPCNCRHCTASAFFGRPARRYELLTLDGRPSPYIHVRHTSVTPVVSEREREYATGTLLPKVAAVHLRKQLRRAFPGVKFSVRTGRGKAMWELSVSWTGGPGRTAVSAVTAPLLATYGPSEERRPARISVTYAGREYHGTPLLAAIALNRA